MHKLGISIYPEHSTVEKDMEYMEMASKYGFSRIFTCLLSVEKTKEEIKKEFGSFIEAAHKLGFEVAADTNPEVFAHLGASPDNLSIFSEMGLDIIRLDGNFGEVGDRLITRNTYGIKIEFNGSSDAALDALIRHGADVHNMMVCHNFYPERYSGLSLRTFRRCNEKWKALGMRTAAFVSSNCENTFGPWAVYAGLPTIELHRSLPIDLQARHLLAEGKTDDIIIGNAFASEEELRSLSEIDLSKTSITVNTEKPISGEERQALCSYHHFGRFDASDYYIRSCQMRGDYKTKSIPVRSVGQADFHRGDVVVVNDNLAHYRGEVEIVLRDMPADGERNLVGRIPKEEFMILDLMEEQPEHFWDFIMKE